MPNAHLTTADLMIVSACVLAMLVMTLLGPGRPDSFDVRHSRQVEPYKPIKHRAPLLTICLIIAASAVVYCLLVLRRFTL